jgi:hypothetical protein
MLPSRQLAMAHTLAALFLVREFRPALPYIKKCVIFGCESQLFHHNLIYLAEGDRALPRSAR